MTLCVVDAPKDGFQCVRGDQVKFFPKDQGSGLQCAAPLDIEHLLKSCKEHQEINVPFCSFLGDEWSCTDGSAMSWNQADNYACLGPKDLGRTLERCKLGSLSFKFGPKALGHLPSRLLKAL